MTRPARSIQRRFTVVARPAAAVALRLQRLLRTREYCGPASFRCGAGNRALAEQPEPVADLPRNLHRAVPARLALRRRRSVPWPTAPAARPASHQQCAEDHRTDTNLDHDAFDVTDRAEIRVSNPRVVSDRPGPARGEFIQTCSNRRCRTSVSLALSITRDSATAIRSGSALPAPLTARDAVTLRLQALHRLRHGGSDAGQGSS